MRRFATLLSAPAALLAVCLGGCVPGSRAPDTETPPQPGFPVRATIATDHAGVPHITARDQASLFYALGYVEGRDRLWQLQYWRAISEGRSSEFVGNDGLQSDGFFRAMGLVARCDRAWAGLPAESVLRRRARAFTAGLNAYIAEVRAGRRPLPREFRLTGTRPGPWRESTTLQLLFLQGVNLDLSTAAAGRDSWAKANGVAAVRRRWALCADDLQYVTLPSPAAGGAARVARGAAGGRAAAEAAGGDRSDAADGDTGPVARRMAALRLWGPGASNEFAVGGSRTVSGKPLLANDAHLEHLTPSQWYAVALEVPDTLVAAGFTVPGIPLVVSGRNRDAAWGVTALGADVSAVTAESLSADGKSALHAGRWERIREVKLDLSYRLGPFRFPLFWVKARIAPHGVLLSEDRKARRALALDWYPLRDHEFRTGSLEPERATSAQAAVDAFGGIPTPTLNLVAADRAGHLAYRTVGWVPGQQRPRSPLPEPGWEPASEWAAPIPADSMPAGTDPATGYFVNCNNRPAGPEYPYALSDFYMDYRALRVDELLRAAAPLDVRGLQRVQLDVASPQWRRFAPRFLEAVAGEKLSEEAGRARMALAAYDGRPDSMTLAPVIFRTWYAETRGRFGPVSMDGFLDAVLDGRAGPAGPGDSTSGPAFSRLMAGTLERAVKRLHRTLGPLGMNWAWGRAHRAHFEHALEKRDPKLAPPDVWVAGDNQSVNVGTMPLSKLPRVSAGPSMRHISDLAQDSTVLLVIPPGNSGDPASPHFADHLEAWARGRYMPVRLGRLPAHEVESVVELDLPRR
ncbi:MAG: penicillin acylase family protein [Candidatus Eisenbacteria bacterium]|nr:penicillin acylase family protein [Candidatus Eisenbacteria bacterium]